MNLFIFFFVILFTLFKIFTCAVIPTSSNLTKSNDSNGAQELASSSSTNDEKKGIVPRKGVDSIAVDDVGKVEHSTHSISADRASTTITKDSGSKTNVSELSSSTADKDKVTNGSTSSSSYTNSSNASDKYSPSASTSSENSTSRTSSSNSNSESKSTSTNTSNSTSRISSSNSNSESKSTSTNTSKSVTTSTESTSSVSSSINKKPIITYSIEDDPSLLNVNWVRQSIKPLTPLDTKAEGNDNSYSPPSSEFVMERMQSKRELYIFPLVVLIFLVPMVLGVGIIVLRRVRDYWSTRHYRRMDFLVDGMYNT